MKVKRLRWGLLAIFPIGYLACSRTLGPLDRTFLVLTIINVLAMGLLLSRLSGPAEHTMWAWAVLMVFLTGVFLKMFWFVWNLNDSYYINRNYAELRWVTSARINDGYRWATLGFVVFCVSAAAVLSWARRKRAVAVAPPDRVLLTNPTTQLVVGLVITYLLLSLLQLRLGYGVLGVANPVLPGRLGTVITFLRQNLIPGLLLLTVWLFDHTKPRAALVSSLLIMGLAVIDSLLSTSRGSILYLGCPVFFLWLITKRVTHGRRLAITLMVLAAVAIYPIATAQRQARISNQERAGGLQLPSLGELADSGFLIITRPSGVEGIWYGEDYQAPLSAARFLRFVGRQSMTDYYTRSVVRVSLQNDFRAPGAIGGQMIIGGATGVVVLMTLTIVGLGVFWYGLRRLQVWPVALAIAAPQFAVFVSGGIFDFLLMLKLVLTVGCCEFVFRRIATRRRLAAPSVPDLPLRRRIGSPSFSE